MENFKSVVIVIMIVVSLLDMITINDLRKEIKRLKKKSKR